MFWLGLILGIIAGIILALICVYNLMYYLGEHPEKLEYIASDILTKFSTQVTESVLTQLNNKYYKIPDTYKTLDNSSNPFKNVELVTKGDREL